MFFMNFDVEAWYDDIEAEAYEAYKSGEINGLEYAGIQGILKMMRAEDEVDLSIGQVEPDRSIGQVTVEDYKG